MDQGDVRGGYRGDRILPDGRPKGSACEICLKNSDDGRANFVIDGDVLGKYQ